MCSSAALYKALGRVDKIHSAVVNIEIGAAALPRSQSSMDNKITSALSLLPVEFDNTVRGQLDTGNCFDLSARKIARCTAAYPA